ncbi:sulfotransferase [Maritimibacter sp. UBA3975]|uniref:sulfotransferase n=1 Tax=Maritimibacter sp. UBA3975 TaxID=1946833 RepID=UPI0025C6CB88|nr:sulfotransferase [Maritimibacter sp. UBA3975]|tara:strand:- start:4920 stop:5780 length:861 start_codon:yes stop_codon:yes gene_type:complete
MSAQTLIYCVGAAKAGTSWLFDYLYSHHQTYFPTVKELNYWNAVAMGAGQFYRGELERRKGEIAARHAVTKDDDIHAYQLQSMADIEEWLVTFDGKTRDDKAYLGFIGAGLEDARLVGDFSPAYALLGPEWFAEMAKAHENVKFLYLLREPVDRLWSHFRMNAGGDEAAATGMVDGYLAGGETTVARRSNYRRTVKRLLQAVPEDRIHVELYERLFTQDALEKMCDFLGIDAIPADFGKRVHGSPKAGLDPERRARLQAALKPQYNFIEQFMGTVPVEWQERMVAA